MIQDCRVDVDEAIADTILDVSQVRCPQVPDREATHGVRQFPHSMEDITRIETGRRTQLVITRKPYSSLLNRLIEYEDGMVVTAIS